MESFNTECQRIALEKYKRVTDKPIQYGTAGFRTRATGLAFVLYRMGILAALRSRVKRAAIGVMITASHNPEEDNGVKLIDPHGEMLVMEWESLATSLVNVRDQDLVDEVMKIVTAYSIDFNEPATVIVGHDTRESSPALRDAAVEGSTVSFAQVIDKGLLATPQLHYIVNNFNINNDHSEQSYFNCIISAFTSLCRKSGLPVRRLHVDGANGIGALKMKQLRDAVSEYLDVVVANDGTSGKLNYLCGSDYVKVHQKPCEGVELGPGDSCASFDGDADRLIYFYLDSEKNFRMLDGDRLSALFATFIQSLIKTTGLNQIQLGIVQTAYANGNSTNYMNETLGVKVDFQPTGVKYLHHKAQQFDIGVYFEANGHGTVLFSQETIKRLKDTSKNVNLTSEQRDAANTLILLSQLINQTVGDAIADMLAVEAVLRLLQWSMDDWFSIYKDLPNKLVSVKGVKRSLTRMDEEGTKFIEPKGLQTQIESMAARYKSGRSFARPSGTEDVVRVYAEADEKTMADELAASVADLIAKTLS